VNRRNATCIVTPLAALLLWVLVVGASRPASAAEAGTSAYLKGYKDFLSGIVPPAPGLYLSNDVIYYDGSISQTTIGGRVSVNLKQWFVSDVLTPAVVTPYTILGGTYAFGAAIPIIDLTGYLMEQVTGDSGSGAVLGANKASVWALGPAATYSFLLGKTPMTLLAKWTHEVAATRTFEGDTVTTALSLKF